MPTLASQPTTDNPTLLFIGPAGSGKTTFMTRFGRVYILNVDKNLNGPTKVLRRENRDLANVEYDYIDTDADGKAVPPLKQYTRFAALLSAAMQRNDLDAIGITSTTTLGPVFADEVRNQLNKPASYAFEIRDWGTYLYLWQTFMRTLRSARIPVILDGHWEGSKDDVTGAITHALALPGKISGQLPALFSDVFRFEPESVVESGTVRTKYFIRTTQERLYPGVKAAFDVPEKFEATQEWADKIRNQFPKRN